MKEIETNCTSCDKAITRKVLTSKMFCEECKRERNVLTMRDRRFDNFERELRKLNKVRITLRKYYPQETRIDCPIYKGNYRKREPLLWNVFMTVASSKRGYVLMQECREAIKK